MMADAEQKLANLILERALAHAGRAADRNRYDCRLVWRDGLPDFVVTLKPEIAALMRLRPRMLRRLPSRRPRLPNRFNKRRTTCILRMEHRRNRRWVRTFVHATPVAPTIRAPRVLVPPW